MSSSHYCCLSVCRYRSGGCVLAADLDENIPNQPKQFSHESSSSNTHTQHSISTGSSVQSC